MLLLLLIPYGSAPEVTFSVAAASGPAYPVVELALPTKPTEAPLWVDVTPYVEAWSIRRGKQGPLESAGVGTGSLALDNRDRRFDPTYTDGPYYGNLKSTRRGRIRAVRGGRGQDYAAVIRSDGPVGYWRLGESSGTTASDASGNGLSGTYTGGVTLAQSGSLEGDADTAALFDGTDDYMSVAHAVTLAITGRITLEAWVYPTSTANNGHILAKGSGTAGPYRFLLLSGQTPAFIAGDGATQTQVNAASTVPLNEWSHVVVTLSGTTVTHYKNGEPNGTGTIGAQAVADAGTILAVGRNGSANGGYFIGRLDESAVYPFALSADRIAAHYDAGTDQLGQVEDLMHFYVDAWPLRRENYGNQYVEVTFSDALKILNLPKITITRPEERTDERIAALLSALNWTTGQGWILGDATYGVLGSTTILAPVGDRSLDQGAADVQGATLTRTHVLSHFQAVERTEFGFLFHGRNGAVTFHNRIRRLTAGSQANRGTFGDDLAAGEIPYAAIALDYDESLLWNEFAVTREGGTEQVASDAESQEDHFPRTLEWATLGTSDADSASIAAYLKNRYGRQQLRVSSLVLDPETGDESVWPILLTAELGDVYTVRHTPLGGGNRIEQVSFLDGLAIDWRAAGNDWGRPVWTLSAADTTPFWVLGISELGVTTALAA